MPVLKSSIKNKYLYFRKGHKTADFRAMNKFIAFQIPKELVGKRLRINVEVIE